MIDRIVPSHQAVKYLLIIACALLAVFIASGSSPVHADNVVTDVKDDAYDKCKQKETGTRAIEDMVKNDELDDDAIDNAEGDSYNEKIDTLIAENEERVNERRQEYEERDDAYGKAQRAALSAKCNVQTPLRMPGAAADELSEWWDGALGKFVDAIISGNTQALQQVMTLWLNYSISGATVDEQAKGVTYVVWTIAAAVFLISLVVIGARMAAQRRQGLADGMEDLGMFYGRFLIIGVVVPMIVSPALMASDSLTDQIITMLPGDQSLEEAIDASIPEKEIFEPALLLIPILFSLAGTITQMVALAARVLILPIITGLLPVAAAFGGTESGKTSARSMVTWIVAAIAFKPLAALLYVLAFNVAGSDSITNADGAMGTIMKLLILGIAGFSPLMLLKIVSPALAGVSGQNSAATMGAIAGAVGGTAAVALGGAAAGASALGGGSATGGAAAGKGGGGKSGSVGGSPTPPSGTGGGGPSGGDPSGGPTNGPSGVGGGAGGSAAGGSPSGGQTNGGSSDGRPTSGSPDSGGSAVGGAPGGASGGTSAPQKSRPRRTGAVAGGLKVASRAASRAGGTYASAMNRTGAMVDDIAK